MSVSDSTTEGNISTDRAVVGSLRTRVPIVGPSKWLFVELICRLKESVLLLNSVPSFFSSDGRILPNLHSEMPEVRVGRNELLALFVLPVEGFTEHQYVVSSTEGVPVEGNRL